MNPSLLCRFFSLVLAGSALMACAADASEGDERAPATPPCEGQCEATVERAVLPASPAPELRQEAPAAYQQRAHARTTHGPLGTAPEVTPLSCVGGVETKCDGRGTCWCPTTQLGMP
jgi:uncharacterized membrane protein